MGNKLKAFGNQYEKRIRNEAIEGFGMIRMNFDKARYIHTCFFIAMTMRFLSYLLEVPKKTWLNMIILRGYSKKRGK